MLKLRSAVLSDLRRLFVWRNDPETRRNSRNTDPVSWDDHVAWFARAMDDASRHIFIAELDQSPIGTVRADYGEDCELSWTVAPEHRAKGYGKKMVACFADSFTGRLIAEVKSNNAASRRIAESIGMRYEGSCWVRPALVSI